MYFYICFLFYEFKYVYNELYVLFKSYRKRVFFEFEVFGDFIIVR